MEEERERDKGDIRDNRRLGNFFKMKEREEIQYHEKIGIPVEKI
jgi:hypothetical protein